MELAPQYFLGNLPSSDAKELLTELRQREDTEGSWHSRVHRDADGAGDAVDRSDSELCAVQ